MNMREKIVCNILVTSFLLTIPVRAQESSPTEEIVVKSTDILMSQITANMKLTQDQISAVHTIIEDNIVAIRNLQLRLENGTIDGKTLYIQREKANREEDQKLSQILTSDQMRVWMNIQNP